MSTERWHQLDRIFVEALQRPAGERSAFIERACRTDAALKAEALALISAAADSAEFMTTSALELLARTMAEDGWTLKPGDRVGACVVLSRLGAGASGEVWRARDERLGRDVAIKIVLPHASSDGERRRRFAEEARLIGSLNHPNLLTVYDVGEHAGLPILVTECLDGQSLRRRLEAGPLTAGKAIPVALGVVRGLVAAHARGVVHRDVKPENVFIRTDGEVKILDFGLAKLLPPAGSQPPSGSLTMDGWILGTAGYMAPEQVRGEPVDPRADLFAVGVITYEMLSGRNPFKRASIVETLHTTLTAEAPDLPIEGGAIPAALARLVMRLLQKDPHARFQTAQDLAWVLEQLTDVSAIDRTASPRVPARQRPGWLRWAVASAVLAAGLLGAWVYSNRAAAGDRAAATPMLPFTFALPEGLALDSKPVISPDGQQVAFTARADGGESRLFVRKLEAFERDLEKFAPVALPGTERAKQPFWSSDGTLLGFFANGKLMKLALPDGTPVPIADAMDGRGATWNSGGTIVFQPDLIGSPLFKVAASGGRAEPVTLLDRDQTDLSHRWPVFLPDGRHFLCFIRSPNEARRGVYVGQADGSAAAPGSALFTSESEAVWVPDAQGARFGDLLSVNHGRLEVRRFDAERLMLIGDARVLDLPVGAQTPYHPSMFSASPTTLALAGGEVPFGQRLASVNRTGAGLQTHGAEAQGWVRLAPRGRRRLARQRILKGPENPDIWVDDLERGTSDQITRTPLPDIYPVWSPDATRLAYVSGMPRGRPGERVISIAAADGSGDIETFACPGGPGVYCEPTDWAGDRLYVTVFTARGSDVWTMTADRSHAAAPLLKEPYNERDSRVSPDANWIAYVSDESGRPKVSVRSLVGSGRILLSPEGGDQPVWRQDGRELFFVDRDGQLRVLSVSTNKGDPFGLPTVLPIPKIGFGHWGTQYDVSPDGRIIFFMQPNRDPAPGSVTIVRGWRSLLK